MKTFIVSLSFFLMFFLSSTQTSLACVCVPQDKNASLNQQVRDAYKNAGAVFAARVISIEEKPELGENLITVDVMDVWKGPLAVSSRIVIKTGNTASACKFPFTVGSEYLIYSYFESNWLITNICLRTNVLSGNQDIPILNRITKRT